MSNSVIINYGITHYSFKQEGKENEPVSVTPKGLEPPTLRTGI